MVAGSNASKLYDDAFRVESSREREVLAIGWWCTVRRELRTTGTWEPANFMALTPPSGILGSGPYYSHPDRIGRIVPPEQYPTERSSPKLIHTVCQEPPLIAWRYTPSDLRQVKHNQIPKGPHGLYLQLLREEEPNPHLICQKSLET